MLFLTGFIHLRNALLCLNMSLPKLGNPLHATVAPCRFGGSGSHLELKHYSHTKLTYISCLLISRHTWNCEAYSNIKFVHWYTVKGLPLHFLFCYFSASFCSVVVQHDTELLTGCVQHDIQINLLKSNREGQSCCFLIYEERPQIT